MMKLKKIQITVLDKTRRRISLLALIGVGATFLVILSGSAVFIIPRILPHSPTSIARVPSIPAIFTPQIPSPSITAYTSIASQNTNCTILIPANPLGAQGLATPYQLSATDPTYGSCNESNPDHIASAFVQGVIYDPATGAFSIYNPLVIDAGTQPAVAPTPPMLPQEAVVALWFGFNGDNLTLRGATSKTLEQANCVNGLPDSIFGQFSYCNAVNFFHAVHQGIATGKIQIPTLGIGKDSLPCPTIRDFGMVDEDQSDNVQTQYLANTSGQTAQFSTTNQAQIQNAMVITNPGDNSLLTNVIDPVLNCTPWTAPDLTNNHIPASALPLDELMAAADQEAPIALVPINDPIVLNNNNPSLQKTNLYRAGVDQPPAQSQDQASGVAYCRNLTQKGIARLQLDQQLFTASASPALTLANSLFTFLAVRLEQSYMDLNCQQLLNQPNPVMVQVDANGVAISATFNTGK